MAAPDDKPNVKFKVGDVEYEIPPVDDFDMDEWQIVYDYSGLVLDDFAIAPDAASTEKQEDGTVKMVGEDGPDEKARQRRVGQPAFMRALLHIGYRRVHPDAKDADVRKLTGELKMTELFQDQVEDDAGPPEKAATSSAAASSESGSASEPRLSRETSDAQGSHHVRTGTRG